MKRHITLRVLTGVVAAAVLFGFGLSGSVSAATRIVPSAGQPGPLQAWVDAAKVPGPDTTVAFQWAECSAQWFYPACAAFEDDRDRGWIRFSPHLRGQQESYLRPTFMHELGHVFDGKHLTSADRSQVMRILGYPASVGWQATVAGRAPASEWFAEAARICFMGFKGTYSTYGFPFDEKSSQVSQICSLMVASSKRPAKKRVTFSALVPAGYRFESTAAFDPGTIVVSISAAGRTWKSQSTCTDEVRFGTTKVWVNSCTRKVVAWAQGSGSAKVEFSGIMETATISKAGVLTKASASRKKGKPGRKGARPRPSRR